MKSFINEAVESRFKEEKKQLDNKIGELDQKFEDHRKDQTEMKLILAQMNESMKQMVGKRTPQKPHQQPVEITSESEEDIQGPSKKQVKKRSRDRSHEKSLSKERSTTSRRQSKRDRSPSPTKPSKRSRKAKDDRVPRSETATSNLREQQFHRDEFTNAVTSLPKWFTQEGDINPIGYIAARFGYVHEECRAHARSRVDKGQTYEEWRNIFHNEAHKQVKAFDESSGRAFYTLKKQGKKPTLKLIVPRWFRRQKNRPVAQINPKTDSKNLLTWHTDITFLDNFFFDCQGNIYLKSNNF